jgi:hypothetical protein
MRETGFGFRLFRYKGAQLLMLETHSLKALIIRSLFVI